MKWLPVLDGTFITDVPINMLRNTKLDGVEVMIGVNRDEGSEMAEQLAGKIHSLFSLLMTHPLF